MGTAYHRPSKASNTWIYTKSANPVHNPLGQSTALSCPPSLTCGRIKTLTAVQSLRKDITAKFCHHRRLNQRDSSSVRPVSDTPTRKSGACSSSHSDSPSPSVETARDVNFLRQILRGAADSISLSSRHVPRLLHSFFSLKLIFLPRASWNLFSWC